MGDEVFFFQGTDWQKLYGSARTIASGKNRKILKSNIIKKIHFYTKQCLKKFEVLWSRMGPIRRVK